VGEWEWIGYVCTTAKRVTYPRLNGRSYIFPNSRLPSYVVDVIVHSLTPGPTNALARYMSPSSSQPIAHTPHRFEIMADVTYWSCPRYRCAVSTESVGGFRRARVLSVRDSKIYGIGTNQDHIHHHDDMFKNTPTSGKYDIPLAGFSVLKGVRA
jgi:hypothetical protein